jgi:hypothetical protein
MREGKEVKIIRPGDSFGVSPHLEDNFGLISARAIEDTVCLVLPNETLTQILGDEVQIIICKNLATWAISRHEVLSKLTRIQQQKLIDFLVLYKGVKDQVLMKAGEQCQYIIIPLDSSLLWNDGSKSVACQPIFCFGIDYFFKCKQNARLEHDLKVGGDGSYFQMSETEFNKLMGGNIEYILEKNEKSHEVETKYCFHYQKKLLFELTNVEPKLTGMKLEDFVYIKEIGSQHYLKAYNIRIWSIW